MLRALYTITLIVPSLLLALGVAAWSQATFSPAELDELLAPIALYPDPLLAQVLPAATYPDQLQAAYDFTGGRAIGAQIDSQPWDVSVRAVAHYPSVLKMMADSPDWTTAVGQAYINQPTDVMNSIQRLRAKAKLNGYLATNAQQRVYTEDGYVRIVPAQAQYIYVPYYSPQVVYSRPRASYGSAAIGFGLGLLIGSWLNRDVDWHRHRVYYHGWRGSGWVANSRPRVQINNRHYVNSTFGNRPIPVGRDVRSRDITRYRRDVRQRAGTFATPGVVTPAGPTPTTRPPERTAPRAAPPSRPRPLPTPGPPMPSPRPPRPGVTAPQPSPGAGPRTQPARPGVRQPITQPRTVVPGFGTTPRPETRSTPDVRPGTRSNTGAATPRPAPRTAPTVRPGAAPRGRVSTPSTTQRQRQPAARPSGKTQEKKTQTNTFGR